MKYYISKIINFFGIVFLSMFVLILLLYFSDRIIIEIANNISCDNSNGYFCSIKKDLQWQKEIDQEYILSPLLTWVDLSLWYSWMMVAHKVSTKDLKQYSIQRIQIWSIFSNDLTWFIVHVNGSGYLKVKLFAYDYNNKKLDYSLSILRTLRSILWHTLWFDHDSSETYWPYTFLWHTLLWDGVIDDTYNVPIYYSNCIQFFNKQHLSNRFFSIFYSRIQSWCDIVEYNQSNLYNFASIKDPNEVKLYMILKYYGNYSSGSTISYSIKAIK